MCNWYEDEYMEEREELFAEREDVLVDMAYEDALDREFTLGFNPYQE